MKNFRSWFNIYSVLKIYLLALIVFFLFRAVLFLTELKRIDASVNFSDIFYAFYIGLRFDTVIASYILIVPYIILTALFLISQKNKIVLQILFYFTFVMFAAAFLVSAADIPYFNQFFSRFSIKAFQWLDSPAFVFQMILQEPRYWLAIVPFIILTVFFFVLLKKIWKEIYKAPPYRGKFFLKLCGSILFLILIFIGIRGRIEEKSPIRIGTAYFCNDAFLNQLGLNPNFTLMRSYLDEKDEANKPIQLMDDKEAVEIVRRNLAISNPDENYPLLRHIPGNPLEAKKYNVALVIMESMSAYKMKRHGCKKDLTPFLDSLSNCGLYFENIYSAGIHTYNGIFSSLFSFPALFGKHPMKGSEILKYNGIARELKKSGYSTVYFTTHDGQFDNAEGFLLANDFERVVSKSDYPSEKIKTTLGVPDDYLFEFAIPILNELHSRKKPFFAALLTSSDHGPYYIPEYFEPKYKDEIDQIVEYADWSLKKFIELSSKQKWFDSTIFVFVADHGAAIEASYETPLSYYHTPLIFYAPKIISESKTYSGVGGQIDIFPTIMGLLNLPYINNSLGIDLRKETRPYIYFNGDDKYGVIDNEWLLIVRKDNSYALYKYSIKDKTDRSKERADIVQKMKIYAEANLQTFQYVIQNGKQYYE